VKELSSRGSVAPWAEDLLHRSDVASEDENLAITADGGFQWSVASICWFLLRTMALRVLWTVVKVVLAAVVVVGMGLVWRMIWLGRMNGGCRRLGDCGCVWWLIGYGGCWLLDLVVTVKEKNRSKGMFRLEEGWVCVKDEQ